MNNMADTIRMLMGCYPTFDPNYYIMNEVVPANLYEMGEANRHILIYRDMLMNLEMKGE